MSDAVKKTIAIAVTAALLGVAYYGNFLPMRKSQAFIATLRNTGSARSLQEFLGMFQQVFDMPSPIGQEELVRNFAGTAVGIVNGNLPPQAIQTIIQFVEDSFAPIMTQGRGMSYTQNLYTLGNLHQAAFIKTHDPQYLARARIYYEEGLKLAPRRPQFLYGLLDVYRLQGDPEGVRNISKTILSLWDDPRVKKSVDDFFVAYAAAQRSSTAPTAAPKKAN
jgi:hypothetical protein